MKNLENIISLVVGCVLLLALSSLDAVSQTKSKKRQKSAAKIIKCSDDDADCFLNAAKTCQKATLIKDEKSFLALAAGGAVAALGERKTSDPLPTYVYIFRHEIRGVENGKCNIYSKIEKSDISYTEEYTSYVMKKENITREEVKQRELDGKESFQSLAGREGVCSFQTEKLVTNLKGMWGKKDGNYSTKDFGANCQGSLYNSTLTNQTIELKVPTPPAEPPR